MTSRKHQTHHLHGIRVILFGVLLLSVLLVRVNPASFSLSATSNPVVSNGNVLPYATSMSREALLSSTNSYRASQGLGPLGMNGLLNNSAQNKAQHMVDGNYWAHVAPDGTQPWTFFTQAGYAYRSAAENLAYGFNSSEATVNGWINSPSHRENIVGNYTEVGFGFVNGASYQGGQNTVVVAHYATPQASSPPPAPAPPPPPPPPPPAAPLTLPSETETTPPPQQQTPPTPESSAEAEQPIADGEQESAANQDEEEAIVPVAVGSTVSLNVLDRLRLGNVPFFAILSLSLTSVAAVGFALTHRSLVRHAVANGEKFVMHHPAIDMSVLILVSVLILTTTMGRVG